MSNLKVSVIQANLIWEDVDANLKNFYEQLKILPTNSDVVILPEMFTTGFSMNPQHLAEAPNGKTFKWLQRQAKEMDTAITGSYIVKENDRFYNRLIWMQPDGNYYTYDKKHLFSLSEEPKHYSAGHKKLIIHFKGWKICPLICYDLRFPVWSRNREHYDLLIYVANWPAARKHHWKSLLTARAIENQVYTIGVNRVGNDGNNLYHSGDTSIIDFSGNILFHSAHQEGSYTVTLDFEQQQEFRRRYQFLADMDRFELL